MTLNSSSRAFHTPRRGASIVEAALVLSLALLLLFGILEYCRFFFVRNTLIAAAREGARYAIVHTYDKTTEEVRTYVYQYIRPLGANLEQFNPNLDISLYKADGAGNPVYDGTGNIIPWTDASYGEAIAVHITARYKPTVPFLLGMPRTLIIRVRCCMSSEAN
ncbi:MAG: pilus assembly protein [Gemmatales bacterium]|nr:pilus assembly protein [Gemmatales bacterium]MDW8174558.1 pilus assembly protein [Gemmatales bacterium]MDW8221926.1 pilus assembly protein [Gemmatales bacterium]